MERTLDGEPSFTVLFGASSVGKASTFFLDSESKLTIPKDCDTEGGSLTRKVSRLAFRPAYCWFCRSSKFVYQPKSTNGTIL